MATARPCVGVYTPDGKRCGSSLLPSVFLSPLRPDLVRFVCTNLAKNKRQAYGVSPLAGYQSSAESWGTGRAVSRIPRVPGGGTHRSGQAAFGNMCRGGGMFAPNKTWRRWHRRVNVNIKRYAVAAAVAATGIPALVMARGHAAGTVPELPLVVSDAAEQLQKTAAAAKLLLHLGCMDDLCKSKNSCRLRAGKGKSRNRRKIIKRGPLIIYNKDEGITRAFRNLPGVDLCNINKLNVLKLAPGGTLGRLCIYTQTAFKTLNLLYGRIDGTGMTSSSAPLKKNYHLPRPLLQNADISRIINSDEVQLALKPAKKGGGPPCGYPCGKGRSIGVYFKNSLKRRQHKNLLTNRAVHLRINPAAKNVKRNAALMQQKGTRPHSIIQKKKEKKRQERRLKRKDSKAFINNIRKDFDDKAISNIQARQQHLKEMQQQKEE